MCFDGGALSVAKGFNVRVRWTPHCRVLGSRLTRWGNSRHSPITDSLKGSIVLQIACIFQTFKSHIQAIMLDT